MKTDFKQKLGYWAESLLYLGGAICGIVMALGGFYMLYTIIKAIMG